MTTDLSNSELDSLLVDAIDRGLEVVFEDVIMNDRVDHYTPSFDKEHVNARVQLDMGRTGYQDIRAMYTRKYEEQLHSIIGGYDIFDGDTPVAFEAVPELAPRSGKKSVPARPRSLGVKIRHVCGRHVSCWVRCV
jgi:hypothetical protein